LIFGERSTHSKRQIRDFILYLSGSLVLALIAIVRLPVFTSHFSPAEFGLFSLVSITYSYLSIALYNWINSCVYRYYHEYEVSGQLNILYSNIFILFLAASTVLLLVSVGWYSAAGGKEVRSLVVPAFCFLFTNQIFSVLLVIYKIRGKAFIFNLFQALQAVFSFLLILLLIFHLDAGINAIFTGQAGVNLVLTIILLVLNRSILGEISMASLSSGFIRKMMHYGFVGFISSMGIFILISSDRYVIALFQDMNRVGIYNQVYQVGQVSVYFLVTVFFNSITPGFNKLLTGYTKQNEKQMMNYIYAFVLLILPLTFYVSIFARQVAEFLLGKEFRQGFGMIPWIVISSFLYGLTLFNETKMKFEHRFRPVLWGVIIACLLNAALNFMFVPLWGYSWAAISTFIAYLFLFIYYYIKDDFPYMRDKGFMRIILVSVTILVVEMGIDILIRKGFSIDLNKWLTLVEGAVFLGIYAVVVLRFRLIPRQIVLSPDQSGGGGTLAS
jgi:O-antigen/teichoic acid export membrane protein